MCHVTFCGNAHKTPKFISTGNTFCYIMRIVPQVTTRENLIHHKILTRCEKCLNCKVKGSFPLGFQSAATLRVL